ncbi:transcriptional regulator [Nocardiopsis aegyptia]|uniref:transcriptional regulator n=1 Tax=Nocardiopsis aegyptia TaxID=220378 RepID=UPI00366ADDD4
MDHHTTPDPRYARDRLARALASALTHDDPLVREAAARRADAWYRVVDGMSEGTLEIGSRTPVRGLPAWVTPEVVHGGFATGAPAAAGPLRPHERDLVRRHGLPAERTALYAHHLTEEGMAALTALLDSGEYDLELPEEAALLTVAWLLRAGDARGALDLLGVVEPFAATLCLTPRPAPRRPVPPGTVFRDTVGQVDRALSRRAARTDRDGNRPKAQQEALAVWNPFADRVLSHWLETVRDGRVDAVRPEGWDARGTALLTDYARLADEHTLCSKHRRPKENLAVLLAALRESAEEGGPTARRRGRLQHAVDSMVAKRGRPGSARHTALRSVEAEQAARPTHDVLASVLRSRIADLPAASGISDPAGALAPVGAHEAAEFGVPAHWPVPEPLRRNVLRGIVGTLDELAALGVITSAEVMAGLVPALVAEAEAASASDPALSRLLAAHHRAFSRRRSLLLLNLSSQVRPTELPWVRTTLPHRTARDAHEWAARDLLIRLGTAVLEHFPGTIVPNPMVSQFTTLNRSARLGLPFVEELAADIFAGAFTPKFTQAAQEAGALLADSPYARYYGIDYAEVLALPAGDGRGEGRGGDAFAELCRARAGHPGPGVAGQGMVIEQAQILTTHNLAVLVGLGVRPERGWADLARRAHGVTMDTVAGLPRSPLPDRVRRAAFSWRQTLFFLSLCSAPEQRDVLVWMGGRARDLPAHARRRLEPLLAGLCQVVDGAPLRESATVRRFQGWSRSGYWMLDDAPATGPGQIPNGGA